MTRIDIGASPRPEPEMTSESGGSSDTEEEVGGGGGRDHTAESHHEDKKVGAFSEYLLCSAKFRPRLLSPVPRSR